MYYLVRSTVVMLVLLQASNVNGMTNIRLKIVNMLGETVPSDTVTVELTPVDQSSASTIRKKSDTLLSVPPARYLVKVSATAYAQRTLLIDAYREETFVLVGLNIARQGDPVEDSVVGTITGTKRRDLWVRLVPILNNGVLVDTPVRQTVLLPRPTCRRANMYFFSCMVIVC